TYSRPEDGETSAAAWMMHARGSLVHESKAGVNSPSVESGTPHGPTDRIDLEAVRGRAVTILPLQEFYQLMAERGLAYGPSFQVLDDLHRGVEDAVAAVSLPENVLREAAAYKVHPVLGDALLQLVAGAVPLEEDGSFSPFTYMPVAIRNVRIASK